MRLSALVLTVAAFVGAAAGSPSPGAAADTRRVVAESRFAVTDAPDQAELVQLVVDFPPGASTSLHTHGGQAVNLVLEGEITLRQNGVDRPHGAGQAWTDSTGQAHAAINTGAGEARLLTTFLLPRGAVQTTAFDTPRIEPAIIHEARFPLPQLPAGVEIVQQVADLPPGWRAERAHAGFVASMLMDGEVTFRIGEERRGYGAGEAWSLPHGGRVVEHNASGGTARTFTVFLATAGG